MPTLPFFAICIELLATTARIIILKENNPLQLTLKISLYADDTLAYLKNLWLSLTETINLFSVDSLSFQTMQSTGQKSWNPLALSPPITISTDKMCVNKMYASLQPSELLHLNLNLPIKIVKGALSRCIHLPVSWSVINDLLPQIIYLFFNEPSILNIQMVQFPRLNNKLLSEKKLLTHQTSITISWLITYSF